jgi:hypothetical protein
MTMLEFLSNHPLISITSIEKVCSIPHGTLRKGKDIPERYKSIVGELLSNYGFNAITKREEKTVDISHNVVSLDYVCEARDNTANFYKDKQGLFQRVTITKGALYTIAILT